jgi:hypothetical protein
MTNIDNIKVEANEIQKDIMIGGNAPSSISMDTSKSRVKVGEKTKLSLINGVFDVTLLINLIKDFMPLLAQKDTSDFWHVKIVFISLLFVLQIVVFAILSLVTIVRDKGKLEKMNNMVLFLTSFIFLFEFMRSRFYLRDGLTV